MRAVQVYVLTYEYCPPILLKRLFLGCRYQAGSRAAGGVKNLETARFRRCRVRYLGHKPRHRRRFGMPT
jgi:hypothetical protein